MLSWAVASVLFEEHLKNCRYTDYMQESRVTAAYHVNTIAVQQVALQHIALLVVSRVNVP